MKQLWLISAISLAAWAQTAPTATQPEQSPAPQAPSGTAAQGLPPTAGGAQTKNSQPPASNPQAAMAEAQAAMAASIAQQRASVLKQVSAVTGKAAPASGAFFTVPWVESSAQFIASLGAPPCDPLPTEELDPLIVENAQRQSVQPDLIRAVINEESASRPCAVSPKGAQGLMQLMPATIELFGVHDAFDPKQNVEAGTKLLKQLLTKYNGDIRLALSAYNAGSERVDKDGGVPQIPETVNYVNDILSKLPK
ncbi:MAG TPA: lytic transglycosylase domain-containing protein [Bryobacteraceae bacterium]|nr:lytic transglycosylase domain-containing protein [Bryobacteraceae bacterium]